MPVNTRAKATTTRKPMPDVKRAAIRKPANVDTDREAIMAYLRIRPHLSSEPTAPYLEPLSETSVRMTDFRPSTTPPSSLYTFSHIFPPQTTQSDFFVKTTLPLVKDLLEGQNALLFTYGVTNSGKTYTVQGGSAEGSAGILPRTLDAVFNSIEGLQSDGRYRPVRLHGIEASTPADLAPPISTLPATAPPALARVLAEQDLDTQHGTDPTILPVDRNYEYSVWLSYAEVYNEKVYDLLDSVTTTASPAASNNKDALLLTRKALPVRPSPSSDSDGAGKYIAGLKHFRVTTAAQAKTLVRLGQVHRRVFGTLANSASSRSHGLVTIKIVRGHRGERGDPTTLQISRLTLVDLAGSERTKHTQTTGDRLREAGSINKSLMVLGQCMEVMRANQRRVAQVLGGKERERVDTREVKKGLAVVPFRHSRLTEVLMDYFVGDGRAVMIVNVNPYDTGYDENSHVMKFAALAREVYTTPALAPHQRAPSPTKLRVPAPKTLRGSDIAPLPYRRKVTISMGGTGRKKAEEAHLEVVEEDEDATGQGDDDDEPENPLVDALFDEVENLRMKLFEAEVRCAIVEAETREEVMREMEERMRSMEAMYARRLMAQVEQNERKTDAKIDMLHQSGVFGSPVKGRSRAVEYSDIEEDEDDVETSLLMEDEDDEERVASGEEIVISSSGESDSELESTRSPSPLACRSKSNRGGTLATPRREIRYSDGPAHTPLPREYEDGTEPDADEFTETEEGGSEAPSLGGSRSEDEDDEEEEEWIPEPKPTKGQKSKAARNDTLLPASSRPIPETKPKRKVPANPAPPLIEPNPRRSTRNTISKLERDMTKMSLTSTPGDLDESVVILPNKKARKAVGAVANVDVEYVPGKGETDIVKKKKRQLGKKAVVTEDEIEKVTEKVTKTASGRNIRRMARGSK